MASSEFPPNLDDGELWLPAAIIGDVGAHPGHPPPLDLLYVERLARQLAEIGLLDRGLDLGLQFPAGKPAHDRSHGFGLQRRLVARPGPADGLLYGGGGGGGTGAYLPGTRPVQGFGPGKPVQPQVDFNGQERARVLQRPQRSHGGPSRYIFPVREGGGTGVFLPRVVNIANNSDLKKKNGGDQQKQPSRNAGVGRQGMALQPPPEMGLPPEWTY